MRRILAVTAALVLLMSLLGPAILADRGGPGGAPGNAPVPAPVIGPGQEAQQERAQIQAQTQSQDQGGTPQGPPEDGDDGDAEPEDMGPQHGLDTARAAIERATERFQNGGEADSEDVDDGEDDADDSSEEGVSGRPTVPPGLVVAKQVLEGLANGEEPSDGEASSEDASELRVRLRLTQAQNDDDSGESGEEAESEDEAGPPPGPFGHVWALQRALQRRAMPVLIVGEPVVIEDGSLTVKLWRGNRLARNLIPGTAVELGDSTEVRLITTDGVQVCEGSAQDCLKEWASLDGAYVQVLGRAQLDEDGNTVLIADRITVTVPDMENDDPVDEQEAEIS